MGAKIEETFLDLLQQTYVTYFTKEEGKIPKVSECILTLDVLKFLVSIAWEGKVISNKHFEDVAVKLDEAGRMFGGWLKSLNNPDKKNRDP